MILKSSIKFIVFCVISTTLFSQKALHEGTWKAHLQLGENVQLPLKIEVKSNSKKNNVYLYNDLEIINLGSPIQEGDSLVLKFPDFYSSLKFSVNSKNEWKGYWINYNKGDNYKIPFYAVLKGRESKIKSRTSNYDFSGRWKTTFSKGTSDEELAIGIFKSKNNKITGTFLTETGDYRFLEGKIEGKNFYLSCLDGSHAFLFTGSINDQGKIDGNFYSGKHYQTKWEAVKDDTFKLADPSALTYTVSNEPLTFSLTDINGKVFNFPDPALKDKVVIIQIMGTWCPNCMDETIYFKELYEKYHERGLEIISIGYETSDTFESQAEKIRTLQKRHQLKFIFLVGGKANKNLASKQFPVLNKVMSYPTSIFIGKDGEIKKIYTGFNGPGTGDLYQQYMEETNQLIENLLK